MINRAKLSHQLKKSADLSHREASVCVDVLLDTMVEGIAKGERIELRGFGTFEVKQVSARKHPTTFSGNSVIPAHGRVVFRPSRKLRDSVWGTEKS
jgi:nucleoid DNA-binding protein